MLIISFFLTLIADTDDRSLVSPSSSHLAFRQPEVFLYNKLNLVRSSLRGFP
ncbi:hypothetical protein [Arsenophonus sp.]|uniref:hypothetical protein n=1 Tax=Arsenophonus sp. TaxID=1872640 RepID=UPI00286054B4|nr:hypothetical protein [Arsenophonus sp.]MDR5615094.1 hypothetical protein [Arsenophonus sp.]